MQSYDGASDTTLCDSKAFTRLPQIHVQVALSACATAHNSKTILFLLKWPMHQVAHGHINVILISLFFRI